MQKKQTLRLSAILLSLMFVLAACRKEEPLPTAVPTAIPPGQEEPVDGGTESTPAPAATATTEPDPVAVVDPDQIDWPPQVVYSSPAPGEEALLNGAITIRFDQPMDQASVEDAFAVHSDGEGGEAVDGTFIWPRQDTLVFTPQKVLKRQQTYRVNIGQQASSAKGFSLDEPLELFLQTVGFLQVSQVIPSDGVREVQTDAAITVVFNRPVVPLVATSQQASLPQPLVIEPPVDGKGTWVSTSIYRFEPQTALAGDTAYQVSIAAALEDIAGSSLENEVSWQFTTVGPEVVTISPENGITGVDPSRPITITFNMPMDRSITERSVSLRTPNAAAVQLTYAWSDDDRVLAVTPGSQLRLGVSYQVGVAQGASSAAGGAALSRDVLSGFTTVPLPSVVSVRPPRGGVAERWQRGISVEFASPMDWDTLEGRVRIEPDPGDATYFYGDRQLNIDFELQRLTEYVVTIPGEATDPYGNALGTNYTWRFVTPESDAVASLNLPARVSQISTSSPSQVDIIHRNISQLDVSLYSLGMPLNLINEPYNVNDYRPAIGSLRSWSFSPDTPQERAGVISLALADGGTLATGTYLISLQAPETDQNARYWQNQQHLLIVADTNIVVKEMFGEIRVWVTDLSSGQPVSGRSLVAYNRAGTQIGNAVSDSNGFARFVNPPDDYLAGVTVISGRPGEPGFGISQSQWNEGVAPWQLDVANSSGAEAPVMAYIYTDRPIYRPGDTVHYKGIVRDANYGRYAPPSLQTVEVVVSRAFYFGDDSFEDTVTVTLDESGTFSGEYQMPDSISLGTYQFEIRGEVFGASRRFSVAEYRKPEFLLAMAPEVDQALRGQAVEVTLEASYFFGGPASDLEVNWTIHEDAYRPESPGPFYSFADDAGFVYQDLGFFGLSGGGFLGNYLMDGTGRTDGDGRLVITIPATLLDEIDAGSRKINVEATVTDLSNFPVSTRASLVLHAAETYVGIAPTDYLAVSGRSAQFDLVSIDWNGQAVPRQNVEVLFYRREWKRNRDSQYGMYRTTWEPVDTEVERTQLTTDGQGKATASFVPESGGSYLAVATITDSGGRTQTSSSTVWVVDSSYGGWRTDPKARSMDLVPDSSEYRPGDTARILVQSPFEGPVRAWLTIERGTLIDQRVVTLQSSSEVLDIPIGSDYAPNVFVTVTAIKGVTPNDSENPFADVRLGIAELVVSPEQLALNVELSPRQSLFSPGETAIYDILVTDYLGRPVQADLSLALVDLAVLTLMQDNAPDIHEAFYARQPYRSVVGSGLFISGEGVEVEIPQEALGLGGGGGGGAADEMALSRAAGDEDEADVRRDFPDTAFWRASIRTDAAGRATAEIPLPDSLTTWRLSSKAVSFPASAGTLVGQTHVDVVVTLPLLLRPVTPRFFTVGDVLKLGTLVNNNSSQPVEAAVRLEADGLTLHNNAEQMVTVPANGRSLVQWQVMVDDVPFADLTFRVEGGGFSDATKPTFSQQPDGLVPVYRYDAEDVVGTSGVLVEAGRRVEALLLPPGVDARQGEVRVALSPSLAAAVIDALDYTNLEDYLTACAHPITDRLLPNVATSRALIELGLANPGLSAQLAQLIPQQINSLQGKLLPDGGWGWCYGDESDPWLTAYSLLALAKAADAGYVVSPDVTSSATAYIGGEIQPTERLADSYEVNRQAFFLYVLAETGQDMSLEANALFDDHRALLDAYARAFLALTLHLSGDQGNAVLALMADLNDAAVVSATGVHWEDGSHDFRNLNSDVRGTAIIISALSRIDGGNELLAPAVRWLMVGRRAQHWNTGHETAWSISALTDWMMASGELEGDYEYAFNVNANSFAEGSFTPATITESESLTVPISQLAQGEVNFLDFQRGLGNGRLYYTVHLDSFVDAASVSAVSRGVTVQRAYFDAACDPQLDDCLPIDRIQVGQQVRVELTVIAPNDLLYAQIQDPVPAGAEAIDPGLQTSASGFGGSTQRVDSGYRTGYWGWWYFNRIEYRDEKVLFLSEFLPAGAYQYTYTLQTNIPGEFQVMPATGSQEFFPEVFGRSEGMLFTIFE